MQDYTFKKVDPQEKELMEKIYRLRLQVYARECGFLDEEDYPQGLESDTYDHHSLHFAAINSDGDVVGTTRMILTDEYLCPLEKHCPDVPLENNIPAGRYAEISRMAISKQFRRNNDYIFARESYLQKNSPSRLFCSATISLGLYREIYRESKERGITHWCALMEKGLKVLLKIYGIKFECIGEEIDIYGPVRPYLGLIDDFTDSKIFNESSFSLSENRLILNQLYY